MIRKNKMMKRIAVTFTALTMTTILSACTADAREEETVNDNNSMTEIASEVNEEDKGAFATGIAVSEEESSGSSSVAKETLEEQEVILNNEIEERCPVTYTADRKNVTYGEYAHGTYFSKTCGLERGYCILLPADYSTDKKYPVLYLLHGIFGNEYSF